MTDGLLAVHKGEDVTRYVYRSDEKAASAVRDYFTRRNHARGIWTAARLSRPTSEIGADRASIVKTYRYKGEMARLISRTYDAILEVEE